MQDATRGGGGSSLMTGELQRISCTGGSAREQGLLRVDDWMCCGGFVGSCMGQERKWVWGLAETPSGRVSNESIRIIVDLFFYGYFVDMYPTRVRYVSVSDT